MKTFTAAVLFLVFGAAFVQAQTAPVLPDSYATAGVFYNTYSKPALSGFGAYAKKVGDSTYSYTVIDVTSRSLKNFKPETTTTTGIAQHLTDFGGFGVFGIVSAGVATAGGVNNTGADVGFAGGGGFMLVRPINKGWTVNIPVRVLASTLGPPQYVVGLGFGWGK